MDNSELTTLPRNFYGLSSWLLAKKLAAVQLVLHPEIGNNQFYANARRFFDAAVDLALKQSNEQGNNSDAGVVSGGFVALEETFLSSG